MTEEIVSWNWLSKLELLARMPCASSAYSIARDVVPADNSYEHARPARAVDEIMTSSNSRLACSSHLITSSNSRLACSSHLMTSSGSKMVAATRGTGRSATHVLP